MRCKDGFLKALGSQGGFREPESGMMKGIFADSINKYFLSTLVFVTRHELSWCYRTQVCVPNTQ